MRQRRLASPRRPRWRWAAIVASGLGAAASLLALSVVWSQEPDAAVTAHGFELTCDAAVEEGSTLACTLSNTTEEAAEWPAVAILHLSSDANRARVVGAPVDASFGTLEGSPGIESDVWWIGDVLVGFSRFDWTGTAAASSETDTADSRTVNITAADDTAWEPDEAFYVSLAPDGSRGVGFLYDNRAKVTIPQSDSKSTDATLSRLAISAGATTTVLQSPVSTSRTVSVGYSVTELTVTPTASYERSTIAVSVGSSAALSLDSGHESPALPLGVGANTVVVTVTAEDGTSTQDYTITVNRAARASGASVIVTQGSFSLTCPGSVAEGTTLVCTLTNTGSRPVDWPVVAFLPQLGRLRPGTHHRGSAHTGVLELLQPRHRAQDPPGRDGGQLRVRLR